MTTTHAAAAHTWTDIAFAPVAVGDHACTGVVTDVGERVQDHWDGTPRHAVTVRAMTDADRTPAERQHWDDSAIAHGIGAQPETEDDPDGVTDAEIEKGEY